MYFGLLKTETLRDRYQFFNSSRMMVLEVLNLPPNNFQNTDRLYLEEKEWQVMLNKLLGQQMPQIKVFQRSLQRRVRRVKHEKRENLLMYMKGNDFNSTFFLREAIAVYILRAEEKQRKEESKEGGAGKGEEDAGKLRGRGRSLYEYLKLEDTAVIQEEDQIRERKEQQIEVLMHEIKNQIRLTNK